MTISPNSSLKERLRKVCRFIDQNLEQPLRLDHLSRVAHCSLFHFQRQFKAMFGVNPAQYIQNQRLRRAMMQLATRPQMSISDIAYKAGFEFSESFSNSFKKKFGVTPTEFRNQPNWQLRNDFIQQGTLSMTSNQNTDYIVDIVNFPTTPVAALEHRGPPSAIMASVKEFITWRQANKLPPSKSATYNIFYSDPEATTAEEFQMDICCGTSNNITANSQGVINKTIAGGLHARIRHQGSEQQLRSAIDYLYQDWIGKSEHKIADRPLFLERIHFFPDVKEHEAITDIYLPIR